MTTNIKKAFAEIHSFLVENQSKKVSTLLDQLTEMMSSKVTNSICHLKDTDGDICAVFCYYHKRWEPVASHIYGTKSNTASGLNSMCKVGVNSWSKQQREFKNGETNLLTLIGAGELSVSDLPTKRLELEANKNAIVYPEGYELAFETKEEVTVYLASLGIIVQTEAETKE